MKRLLLIAYYFPPDGGAGTQRPAKFARYLSQFGWQTTVLTRAIRGADQRGRWDPADDSLLQEVQPAARIVRVAESPTDGDGEWPADVLSSEPEARWMSPVYRAAKHAIEQDDVDAVLITMSPFWLSHLGRRLQNETHVPVIYDLRDPWALDGWQPQRTRWHWQRELRLMRLTLENADGVVANTPESGKQMLKTFAALDPAKLTVITNGYDAADFESAAELASEKQHDEFVLVHSGTLHGHVLYPQNRIKAAIKRMVNYSPQRIVPSGRTIVHLLAAIRQAGVKLRLVLVGQIDQGTQRCIEEAGMKDCVTCTGYVSHRESVQWLLRADGLFLPLHGSPDGSRSLITPGKAYEYLAAGRPILGCLPPGDTRDLVMTSGVGYVADPTSEPQIAAALEGMVRDWAAGKFAKIRPAQWTANYERRALTQRLAEFVDHVVQLHQLSSGMPVGADARTVGSRLSAAEVL